MRKPPSQPQSNLSQIALKYFVSAFVIFSFAAYAAHERLGNRDEVITPAAPAKSDTQIDRPGSVSKSKPAATATNASTAVAAGLYKDGQYIGSEADAYFGQVQVEVIVQSGKITNVQFLDFPSDRRTSQRINSFATPLLTTEAIRAQNAQVDIISGATLTSEAFIESLQSALNQARA